MEPLHGHESPKEDLVSLSLVCQKLRELCLPMLFRQLRVTFGAAGFEKLDKISSASHLTPLVRELSYYVPDFVLPRERPFPFFLYHNDLVVIFTPVSCSLKYRDLK